MKHERYCMSTCPSCGGAECVNRVTGKSHSVSCQKCGMRRDLKLTADPKMGHFIAQPRERGPQHRSHPHHYVATMIAFFGLAAVFVFLIIAQIARYW